jgi:hypothetical protein
MHTKKTDSTICLQQTAGQAEHGITRRSFTKKALATGFLSAVTLMNAPPLLAWMNGKLAEREDLADGLRALVKTYSINDPYPLKFYDALVRVHLENLDFAIRKGMEKEHADHYAYVLGPVVERHIKPAIPKMGKEILLWGIFERTSCSFQLYERIEIKENERVFPCPYKAILEQAQNEMGTYKITWNDVCQKWCTLTWQAFARMAGGVPLQIEPGEMCKVKVV